MLLLNGRCLREDLMPKRQGLRGRLHGVWTFGGATIAESDAKATSTVAATPMVSRLTST